MPRSVIRAAICVLVACVALLAGCSEHIVSRDIQSPDGRLAIRIEINEGGGAAVPDVTSAFIVEARPSAAYKQLIFKGSALSYFDARWANSEQISLSFEGGYVTTCDTSAILPSNLKVAVLGCK